MLLFTYMFESVRLCSLINAFVIPYMGSIIAKLIVYTLSKISNWSPYILC